MSLEPKAYPAVSLIGAFIIQYFNRIRKSKKFNLVGPMRQTFQ